MQLGSSVLQQLTSETRIVSLLLPRVTWGRGGYSLFLFKMRAAPRCRKMNDPIEL